MARIPKQRVIFDAEKYDLDYLRETRDSYSPMTDAEFEDSISYDMGEDDLRDLMETEGGGSGIACRLREAGRGPRHRLTGTRRPLHRVDI